MPDTDSEPFSAVEGDVDAPGVSAGLYTPAMLAAAVGAPLAAIRRWARRGYLRATETRDRVDHYDFCEATVARRLVDLLGVAGSLNGVDRLVDDLGRACPDVERPLIAAPLVIEEGRVVLRDGDSLAEPDGQRLIDFGASESDGIEEGAAILAIPTVDDPSDPRDRAIDLRDEGALTEAIETLRLGMLTSGANAEDHFTLGEWLYELGQLEAARERFYAALELDGEYVEARVNLACVLAESGQTELAVAALRGALEEHPLFADAHYHLAATLERAGDFAASAEHFQAFLEIAPESPWADEARRRLDEHPPCAET